MARPRKEGKKAKGIYSKSGTLYIAISKKVIKNGSTKYINDWISTNLYDTDENIKKAIELRNTMLSNKGLIIEDKNISFEDLVSLYLSEKKRMIADTTYASYLYKSQKIQDYFRNVKVKDISESHINDFLDSLFIKDNLSKRSVKDVKAVFNNIMEYAVTRNIIISNPVKKSTINKRLSAEHASSKVLDDDFFSYEEATAFLDIVKTNKLFPLFHTTLCFGLRREEVLGSKWSAIDFDKGTIKIQHTVTKGTEVVRRDAVKTDGSLREYPLDKSQLEMFRQIKEKEAYYKDLFGNDYNDNDYIFKHEDGALYYPDYPSKYFKKIIKRHPELPQNITFHGLRKTCVSILIHKGYDIKSIQKWVGHADYDTTLKIYAKVKEKEAKNEILKGMIDLLPIGSFKPVD